jgi:nucleotide-binding universal stress UspA family protein
VALERRGAAAGAGVPEQPPSRIRHFLVPVDGSEASYHALAVTCGLARQSRASVSVIYVIEVPRSLPLDSELVSEAQRGERILERAEGIAAQHHVTVEGELLQARQAGHAVVDEAVERGAEAIVVGVDYHRPHGRFQLGRLPQYVLEHAPTLVWLIRYPPPEGVVTTRPGTVWAR